MTLNKSFINYSKVSLTIFHLVSDLERILIYITKKSRNDLTLAWLLHSSHGKVLKMVQPSTRFLYVLKVVYWLGFIERVWPRPQLCNADKHTNGCSVPLGINAPYKEDFTPACNKHDICYGCVSTSTYHTL